MTAITVDEINEKLRKAVALLAHLKKRLVPTRTDDEQLVALQTEIGVVSGETFVADDAWQKKSDDDRSAAYSKLKAFVGHLRRLHWGDLVPGALAFVALAVLLSALAAFYHSRHRLSPTSRISDSQVLDVLRAKEAIGTGLGSIASKDAEKTAAKDPNVQKALAADIDAAFDRVSKQAAALQDTLLKNGLSGHLSSNTLAAWAQLVAQIETRQVAAKGTFETLRKALEPELESVRTRYLWTDVPGRWFEIAWWAEFGTLVGLLFYVAGCLEMGTFRTEELSMFATEILITPLVVTVVFFLFGFTGITGFAPSESNIAQTVGFAFILGFAIRRTVGLLDLIKKRFLPDPSPAGQANT